MSGPLYDIVRRTDMNYEYTVDGYTHVSVIIYTFDSTFYNLQVIIERVCLKVNPQQRILILNAHT